MISPPEEQKIALKKDPYIRNFEKKKLKIENIKTLIKQHKN